MTRGRETWLIASLLVLFVCRAILASTIVPPWQGPDEPTHFVLAALLADERMDTAQPVISPDGDISTTIERDLQRQVLQSMAKHRWWEPYGGRSPDVPPTSFRQIQRLGVGTYAQPFYYDLGAIVLRVTRPEDVEAAYWHLRVFAVLLSMLALAFGWAGTRLLFGSEVAAGASAVAVSHPQFLLTAISVNPDALLNVCGAFMWWQGARLFTGYRRDFSFVLVVIAVGVALFTKRSAMPLVVVAAVLTAAAVFASREWRIVGRNLVFAAVVVVVAAASARLWVMLGGPGSELLAFWRNAVSVRRTMDQATWSAALEYARLSIDYVWLVGGWLRFPAPEPWLWVARCLTVTAFAGAAALWFRSPLLRRPLSIAWLFVIVQVGVVIGLSFWTLASPQGRYLFPVLAPATALLWLGLTRAAPARARRYAAPALIAILATMDVMGFTTVLIPAYLPWG